MAEPDIWDIYEEHGTEEVDRTRLTPAQRQLLAVCGWRQEVNSGGFDGYFRYWGGDTAPEALEVLPGLLGPEWAALLREAMDLMGSPYPTDPDARWARADVDGVAAALGDLDTRYYDLEADSDADALMTQRLREPGADPWPSKTRGRRRMGLGRRRPR